MNLVHKQVNFEDARGSILDIFVDSPKSHCTIIYTKKGGVRGNHYHKESVQHDFIVSGKFRVLGRKMGQENIEEAIAGPNDYLSWEKNEAHEFIAIEDSVFITFVNGPRGGDNFENDTFRLDRPLHEVVESR